MVKGIFISKRGKPDFALVTGIKRDKRSVAVREHQEQSVLR